MTIAAWGAVNESGEDVFGEDAADTQHRYGLMCKARWDIYDGARSESVQSFIGDRPHSADVVLNPAPRLPAADARLAPVRREADTLPPRAPCALHLLL
ncbi:hypothetical protein FA95DRAFT_1566989 [Auriscalpium vulgare]|uniref:Uncharacterized protein n=1 Tax=Auriscalpium vulgare TaxID=40419 RepID=A0ACB8R752_9AGAM|nr:hypothetical protein FA95DRAFT_1566989 [Auriscalpium vulgare]